MADDLQVIPTLEDGIVVLKVSYGPELLLTQAAHQKLSQELVSKYRDEQSKTDQVKSSSCVVNIEATTAGSPLVRALFELYKTVYAGGGQVICVGFPKDYIASLTTLGLTGLPGFALGSQKGDAVRQLSKS